MPCCRWWRASDRTACRALTVGLLASGLMDQLGVLKSRVTCHWEALMRVMLVDTRDHFATDGRALVFASALIVFSDQLRAGDWCFGPRQPRQLAVDGVYGRDVPV